MLARLVLACVSVEPAASEPDAKAPAVDGVSDEEVGGVVVPEEDPDDPVDTIDEDALWAPFEGEGIGDFLYAEGVVHELRIGLREAAVEALEDAPEEDVPATLTWNGDTWYPALHLKGSSTFRSLDGKAAFKIDFHEYDHDARFHGVKRLTLNAMVSDASMMREHAYYGYAASLGVPAPRHGYARVYVNDELYGLYGIVETMDEQFVDRVWPEDDAGALYEGSGADLTATRGFDLDEAGEGDLDALVATLAAAPDEALLATLGDAFDDDALFAYLAMDLAGGNDDGYARNRHNYHLYYAPGAGRWSMIPWGTDRAFEDHTSVYGDPATDENPGVIKTRCLGVPECRARLEGEIRAVADGWDALLPALEDVAELIRPDCEADPRVELDCDPDKLLRYLHERAEEVRAELP